MRAPADCSRSRCPPASPCCCVARSMGAPGGYFGRFGGSSSDDDNMVVGTSDSSIQVQLPRPLSASLHFRLCVPAAAQASWTDAFPWLPLPVLLSKWASTRYGRQAHLPAHAPAPRKASLSSKRAVLSLPQRKLCTTGLEQVPHPWSSTADQVCKRNDLTSPRPMASRGPPLCFSLSLSLLLPPSLPPFLSLPPSLPVSLPLSLISSLSLFPSLCRSIDLSVRPPPKPQGLKPQNVRTFSLAQIPKEPKAVTPYYKE